MIFQALSGRRLPIYGDGRNIRDWIHVADHCSALEAVLAKGREGEVYNVGGDCELENLAVARRILRTLNRDDSLLEFVKDRPAHDRRYALDASKAKQELGWSPSWTFEAGLAQTIRWYQEHEQWLSGITSGEYKQYFDRHYRQREATFAPDPAR